MRYIAKPTLRVLLIKKKGERERMRCIGLFESNVVREGGVVVSAI